MGYRAPVYRVALICKISASNGCTGTPNGLSLFDLVLIGVGFVAMVSAPMNVDPSRQNI